MGLSILDNLNLKLKRVGDIQKHNKRQVQELEKEKDNSKRIQDLVFDNKYIPNSVQ